MWRTVLFVALAVPLYAAGRTYEVRGKLVPGAAAAISLFGANTPFHLETSAGADGRFRFRSLAAGRYIVAVWIPGKGELRRTVELGPATAGAKGRLEVTLTIDDSLVMAGGAPQDRATISVRQLAIPPAARRDYEDAQKLLGRRDAEGAVACLKHAVELAPQFTAAWNNLGTISYQSRQYAQADAYFRKALEQEPGADEPLVNLGGVLLNEGKPDEALPYNRQSVLSRPRDALANSQLGMNYFALGNLDAGQKYLEIAERLDPAHFSFPQLTLARIHWMRQEYGEAARELRDFLRRHPDAGEARWVREQLARLENAAARPSPNPQ